MKSQKPQKVKYLKVFLVIRDWCLLTVFVDFFDLDLKLEDVLIAFGCDSSECNITSSIHSTGIISSLSVITSGISFKSALLSQGMITFSMPPRFAASNFSFKPPIFKT